MDNTTTVSWLEKNTRDLLAMWWSLMSAAMIMYILVRFGDKVEILTLIIGLISGTILGGIMGTYFASSRKGTPSPTSTVGPVAGDVTVNPQADGAKEDS